MLVIDEEGVYIGLGSQNLGMIWEKQYNLLKPLKCEYS